MMRSYLAANSIRFWQWNSGGHGCGERCNSLSKGETDSRAGTPPSQASASRIMVLTPMRRQSILRISALLLQPSRIFQCQPKVVSDQS
jgi:hypothetical protein